MLSLADILQKALDSWILAAMGDKPGGEAKTEAEGAPKGTALAKRPDAQEPGAVKQIVTAFSGATEGYFEIRAKEIAAKENGAKLQAKTRETLATLKASATDKDRWVLIGLIACVAAFVIVALWKGERDMVRDAAKFLAGGLGGYGFGIARSRKR